ncbi:MAG: hypothetical protein E3J43_08560 [Candidatus Heimdallarchaeota archaeon]|nr:MAG: hypothetical protein E3J43_08560 [Candidatus Heimdallarchaeota archaeon]
MATETQSVPEEILKEEVAQPQTVESNESTKSLDAPEETAQKSEDSDKDYNFRQMRETLAQRDEELRVLREASDKSEELGNDDLVEGKHLKKGLSEIRDLIRKTELNTVPDKLKARFENFDNVVSKESLEKFRKIEPELYQTLQVDRGANLSAEELFTKGVSAYKMIKSFGISPENKEFTSKKEQVQSNHRKPMSAQAIHGSGAIHEANAFANGLTPDLRTQLNKEMIEAAKAR